jgi:uncharacterized phage protein (TIGR02216 family)
MSRRFPWAAYMAAGLGQLRLPPEAFWAATPREIAAAFATTGRDTLSRNHLDDLLRRYPDEP